MTRLLAALSWLVLANAPVMAQVAAPTAPAKPASLALDKGLVTMPLGNPGLVTPPMRGLSSSGAKPATPTLDQRVTSLNDLALDLPAAQARDAFAKALERLKKDCPQCAGIIEQPQIIIGTAPVITGLPGGGARGSTGSGGFGSSGLQATAAEVARWIKSRCKSDEHLFDSRDAKCKRPAQVLVFDLPLKKQ